MLPLLWQRELGLAVLKYGLWGCLGTWCILYSLHLDTDIYFPGFLSLMSLQLDYIGAKWCKWASQWPSGQESTCNAGDTGDPGSIPGSGRAPLQYSCLENPMDRGAWRTTVNKLQRVKHDLKRLSTAHISIIQREEPWVYWALVHTRTCASNLPN